MPRRGVRQDSPGRKPWEPWQAQMSALKGRCRQLRPFQAGILGAHVARARALACPARPFQGRSVGGSPSAKMRAVSQGLRPGLSCTTLSGSRPPDTARACITSRPRRYWPRSNSGSKLVQTASEYCVIRNFWGTPRFWLISDWSSWNLRYFWCKNVS